MLTWRNAVTHGRERVEQSGLYQGPRMECNKWFCLILLEMHYKRSWVNCNFKSQCCNFFLYQVSAFKLSSKSLACSEAIRWGQISMSVMKQWWGEADQMYSDSMVISMPETPDCCAGLGQSHCGAVCSFPQRNSLVEINGEQCGGPPTAASISMAWRQGYTH